MKEAEEESGLKSLRLVDENIFDLDKHIIPQRPHVPEHFHFDVRYLFEADINEPLIMSDESGYNPSILRMLEKTSKSEILL